MKIGIEGQRLFRRKKHGMDMVALELIKNLQSIDKENEYFIFIKPDEDFNCLKETDNFHITTLNAPNYIAWEQYSLPRAARKIGCHLLHCTSNTAPLRLQMPLIVTIHDIIYMETNPLFTKGFNWYQRLGNTYRRYVVPRIIKKAAKVITVSDYEKRRIADFFEINNDKLTFVYNGVGDHFRKRKKSENELLNIRLKYNLPEKYFFFLGNTDPKKNTPRVLKAYAIFRRLTGSDIPLVMPDYEISALKKILFTIEEPDLLKHIKLTGYINNVDLPRIYKNAELFLYPSNRESFGIPILEAMASGTPVITSNTSSMPEVAGEAALIVNPGKPEEIANAISELIENATLKKSIINKGKKRASSFSWKNTAIETKKIYESVLNI